MKERFYLRRVFWLAALLRPALKLPLVGRVGLRDK